MLVRQVRPAVLQTRGNGLARRAGSVAAGFSLCDFEGQVGQASMRNQKHLEQKAERTNAAAAATIAAERLERDKKTERLPALRLEKQKLDEKRSPPSRP